MLGLTADDTGEDTLARCRALASLAALVVTAKARYSDTYARAQRSKKMSLQGEMIWALLPPRAFATERVLLSAFLEPAYEAGGDGFDYSMLGDRLHVSLFDALGHNLAAGLLTSVCMASCRSTRRSGDGSLTQIAARADQAIVRQFGDYRFVTALLAELDVGTGQLSWVCRGHPAPLLIRGNQTVTELTRPPELPLGLSFVDKPGAGDSADDDDTGHRHHRAHRAARARRPGAVLHRRRDRGPHHRGHPVRRGAAGRVRHRAHQRGHPRAGDDAPAQPRDHGAPVRGRCATTPPSSWSSGGPAIPAAT